MKVYDYVGAPLASGSYTTDVTFGGTVDLARSFVIERWPLNSDSQTQRRLRQRHQLISPTQVRVTRVNPNGNFSFGMAIAFWVVELDAPGAVEVFEGTPSTTVTSITHTLATPIPVDKAIGFCTSNYQNATDANETQNLIWSDVEFVNVVDGKYTQMNVRRLSGTTIRTDYTAFAVRLP